MTRNLSSMGRRGFLKAGAALAAAGTVLGPMRAFGGQFDGVTLNVMSHPGGIRPIFDLQVNYIKETLGITLNIIESGDLLSYQDALKDLNSGGGQFDIVMHFPRYNAELVAAGYLMPLDDLIAKTSSLPLFDNIVDYYRELYCKIDGQTIASPVDGDVAMMYYNKAAFENPEAQAKFKEQFGKDLALPKTWDEFKEVATFFTGWAWGKKGKPGYGFQTSTWDKGFIEQQWAPMMGSAGGVWFDDDCHPGWNNAAGVRALEDLKALIPTALPGSSSLSWGQTMTTFQEEDIAMTLWYMDLGRFGNDAQKGALTDIGYAEWPGYDVDGVYRNFNSMFYGRVIGISNFTTNADAAFAVLTTLLMPERRVLSMDDPTCGSDMFLKSDYELANFKVLTPTQEFLDAAKEVLTNGFPEMNMVGTSEYMDALQGEIHGYLNAEGGDAAAALQAAADRWEAITDRMDRDAQKERWAKVKASYLAVGLKIAG